jgi:hypothetical protein
MYCFTEKQKGNNGLIIAWVYVTVTVMVTITDGKLGDEALTITMYVPAVAALTVSVKLVKGDAGVSVTLLGFMPAVRPVD